MVITLVNQVAKNSWQQAATRSRRLVGETSALVLDPVGPEMGDAMPGCDGRTPIASVKDSSALLADARTTIESSRRDPNRWESL